MTIFNQENTPRAISASFAFVLICVITVANPGIGLGAAILVIWLYHRRKVQFDDRRAAYLRDRRKTWGF